MSNHRPDYFQSTTPIDALLRRIKGNYRRDLVLAELAEHGLETIPEQWLEHEVNAVLKRSLGWTHPGLRGGEDLPDLLEGEVEIARMTLLDSVHREVTSLRARRGEDGRIHLRLADEYEDGDGAPMFVVSQDTFDEPLTAEEVLRVFRNSEPSAAQSDCKMRFDSDFYPNLDALADELGIKIPWETWPEGKSTRL